MAGSSDDASTEDRRSYTTWTVLLKTTDGWASPDPDPLVLFSYTAPPSPSPAARFVAELRDFADKIETRDQFFTIEQGLTADGFEQ